MDNEEITVSQRSKEYAHDYRYFPEPDLPPFTVNPELEEIIKSRLPELTDAKKDCFVLEYNLSAYDAEPLTVSREFTDYFESCVGRAYREQLSKGRTKLCANWMIGKYLRLLNEHSIEIGESKISPQHLAVMLDRMDEGVLSTKLAKHVLEEMFNTDKGPGQIIGEERLTQITETGEIEPIVEQVLQDNPKVVAEFKKGKEKALQFLVGQVMKTPKGRAKPDLVNKILKEKLE